MEREEQQCDVEEAPRSEGQAAWSWGAGTHGQLGTGAFRDELLPQPVLSLPPVRSVACGGSHAAAALVGGGVATWGNGQTGQLGHGDYKNLSKPTIVRDDYTLYTCGSGGFGQLGHGNCESLNVPRKVESLCSLSVSLAACGMRHTLVLIRSGHPAVYAFGSYRRGQLGIDLSILTLQKAKGCCIPQNVVTLNEHRIASIYANGDHSAALSDSGVLYLWGRSFNGLQDITLPSMVSNEVKLCQVALGWNHVLAVTISGELLTDGCTWDRSVNNIVNQETSNKEPAASSTSESPWHHSHAESLRNTGQMQERDKAAGCRGQSSLHLHLYEPLPGYTVCWVAAGSEHSAVVMDDGTVMTWGWGEHGQLGLGSTDDQSLPQRVSISPCHCNFKVFCGSGFTFGCSVH